jgi:hypothetical protein
MQYDRVFPVAMPGELHILPFCALQRMEAEIPAAVQIGGSARIIFVGVRHLASHHRPAVTPAGQALPCRYRIRNVPPLSCSPAN